MTLIRTALAAAFTLVSLSAVAQYPDKQVKIIVPYPPAGTTDILARLIAAKLTDRLKQAFVVENRPGAGGAIGTVVVAKSPADGYTLLMGTVNTHGINTAIIKNLPYDAIREFYPVTIIGSTPNVLAVNPSVPAKTLAELLALARAKPGSLNFGSTSPGGSPHMSGELLKALAQVDIAHIPYKGLAPAMTDLLSGQVQLMFSSMVAIVPQIKAGKLRALAVTGAKRSPLLPDVPTLAESGLTGYEAGSWYGLLAPAGTSPDIIRRINLESVKALRQMAVRETLVSEGAEVADGTPDDFARHIRVEYNRIGKMLKDGRLKME